MPAPLIDTLQLVLAMSALLALLWFSQQQIRRTLPETEPANANHVPSIRPMAVRVRHADDLPVYVRLPSSARLPERFQAAV